MLSIEYIAKELNTPVRECMRKPVTVSPSESVSSLLSRMIVNDIGAIIVIEKGTPVGMITEKDILERVIMENKNVYTTTAKDVMSKPLIAIESDCSIKEAMELMQTHNIRRLAITENRALIGLVTERRLSTHFLTRIM